MDKKEIQRQRMMKYFIEAAKEFIREQGVKNVTVRKVADLAGYFYATLYNYFKDLDELLYYCISDLLDECYEYVQSTTEQPKNQVVYFKSHIINYVEYFMNNPNIFQAIFVVLGLIVTVTGIRMVKQTVEELEKIDIEQTYLSDVLMCCLMRNIPVNACLTI